MRLIPSLLLVTAFGRGRLSQGPWATIEQESSNFEGERNGSADFADGPCYTQGRLARSWKPVRMDGLEANLGRNIIGVFSAFTSAVC